MLDGEKFVDSNQAFSRFRLRPHHLCHLRDASKVSFIQVTGAGAGLGRILNHLRELESASAEYSISQAEVHRWLASYHGAERQRAPNGAWYLSPRAFCRFVNISANTLFNRWRPKGVPILDHEPLDTHKFRDANGRLIDFYSEKQGRKIIKAREDTSSKRVPAKVAAQRCGVDARYVTKLAKDRKIDAVLQPTRIRGRLTKPAYLVDVDSLHKSLRQKEQAKTPQRISDPIGVKDAARCFGIGLCTLLRYIRNGRIDKETVNPEGNRGWGRWVLSRRQVVEFVAQFRRPQTTGSEEKWLFPRHVRIQFGITKEVLYRYGEEAVPPMGRPLHFRLVDRPPGLRCRSARVRQWAAEDARRLSDWLKAPEAATDAGPQPIPEPANETPKRRGRKISDETLEVGKYCYEQLRRDIVRSVICKEVHRLFSDRDNFDESAVTIYAWRYAKNPADPKPWPI
jgi:hypothetical protein